MAKHPYVVRNESAGIQLDPEVQFSIIVVVVAIILTSAEHADVVDLEQERAPWLVDQFVLDDLDSAETNLFCLDIERILLLDAWSSDAAALM